MCLPRMVKYVESPAALSGHGMLTLCQNGFTHMFVVDFASVEDRDYYLVDPAHQAVVAGLKPVVEKVQVMDIEV